MLYVLHYPIRLRDTALRQGDSESGNVPLTGVAHWNYWHLSRWLQENTTCSLQNL